MHSNLKRIKTKTEFYFESSQKTSRFNTPSRLDLHFKYLDPLLCLEFIKYFELVQDRNQKTKSYSNLDTEKKHRIRHLLHKVLSGLEQRHGIQFVLKPNKIVLSKRRKTMAFGDVNKSGVKKLESYFQKVVKLEETFSKPKVPDNVQRLSLSNVCKKVSVNISNSKETSFFISESSQNISRQISSQKQIEVKITKRKSISTKKGSTQNKLKQNESNTKIKRYSILEIKTGEHFVINLKISSKETNLIEKCSLQFPKYQKKHLLLKSISLKDFQNTYSRCYNRDICLYFHDLSYLKKVSITDENSKTLIKTKLQEYQITLKKILNDHVPNSYTETFYSVSYLLKDLIPIQNKKVLSLFEFYIILRFFSNEKAESKSKILLKKKLINSYLNRQISAFKHHKNKIHRLNDRQKIMVSEIVESCLKGFSINFKMSACISKVCLMEAKRICTVYFSFKMDLFLLNLYLNLDLHTFYKDPQTIIYIFEQIRKNEKIEFEKIESMHSIKTMTQIEDKLSGKFLETLGFAKDFCEKQAIEEIFDSKTYGKLIITNKNKKIAQVPKPKRRYKSKKSMSRNKTQNKKAKKRSSKSTHNKSNKRNKRRSKSVSSKTHISKKSNPNHYK